MEKVITDVWGYREIVEYIHNNVGIGQLDWDNDGQIIIYTGLYEDEDGNVVDDNPNWQED